ncbi:hypothetical protein BJV82DRAFT_286069 [Fennellomyces sp. T-0311]|nr:hypothetical protein BJV82DRAFT_286069 [Fennellomyces sp. T-0311]
MADDPGANFRSFDKHCYDGVCHCDWRLTLQDCVEGHAMWYVNVVNIAISAVAALFGIGLLFYRIGVKGHSLWTNNGPSRGCLRPKPVDSMLVLLLMFNLLRLVTSIVLLVDIGPGNWIARSFVYEISWSFGLGGITLYLIGIGQTIAQSHSAQGWLPSPLVVDIIGVIALFIPLFVGTPLTIAAGAMVEAGRLSLGETLIRISYCTWFIWTGGIGTAVLIAAHRLVRILKNHHKKFRQGSNYAAVKSGIFKIQIMAFSYAACLWCFAIVLLLYGILRDQIMANTTGSIFLGAVWAITAGFTTLIVHFAVVISPDTKRNAALKSKSSSGGKVTNTNNEITSNTTPDRSTGFGVSTMDPDATGTFDQEAIANALKINDGGKPWLKEQPQRGKNAKQFKTPQRRMSETSSQLELTSYER